MGFRAVYIAVSDAIAEELWSSSDQAFRKRFWELEEDAGLRRLDIGKVWDVLHCTLTGVSASTPVEGHKLSEAIVGVHPRDFEDGDSLFVSLCDNGELPGIIEALSECSLATVRNAWDPKRCAKEKVYPTGIWKEDASTLIAEMHDAARSLQRFFAEAESRREHVLVSIT